MPSRMHLYNGLGVSLKIIKKFHFLLSFYIHLFHNLLQKDDIMAFSKISNAQVTSSGMIEIFDEQGRRISSFGIGTEKPIILDMTEYAVLVLFEPDTYRIYMLTWSQEAEIFSGNYIPSNWKEETKQRYINSLPPTQNETESSEKKHVTSIPQKQYETNSKNTLSAMAWTIIVLIALELWGLIATCIALGYNDFSNKVVITTIVILWLTFASLTIFFRKIVYTIVKSLIAFAIVSVLLGYCAYSCITPENGSVLAGIGIIIVALLIDAFIIYKTVKKLKE